MPPGLERLSSIWTAPIPDYAPGFMHNESFGYIMSALIGGGLIILLVPAAFPGSPPAPPRRRRERAETSTPQERAKRGWASSPSSGRHRHRGGNFLERLAGGLVHAMDHALDAEAVAAATACCKGSTRASRSRRCWTLIVVGGAG